LAELLVRLLAWMRPREGWGPFLLALTAVLCLPAAILSARQPPHEAGGGLIAVALLAMALGVRLARTRLAWRGAAVAAVLLGAATATVVVGRLVPPLGLAWREAVGLYVWLRDLPHSLQGAPPLVELSAGIWQQLQILGARLWWSTRGGGATDPALGDLLVALLTWGCTFFAAWQIYRRRRPLLGLLPAGIAAAVLAFFQGGMPVFYLFSLVFCTLWLVALHHLAREQESWDRTGTDYPDALQVETSMVLLPWLVGILFLAAVSPVLRLNAVRDAFWRHMDEPWSRLQTAAERYVGPIDSGGALGSGVPRGGSPGELPQSHLLGSGPELREVDVLRVRTSDPPPEVEAGGAPPQPYPRRYWRHMTFDTYTGLGWINDAQEVQEVAAGAPLAGDPSPGEELWQEFQIVGQDDPWLYAANAPYRLDVPVQAWRRANGDLLALAGNARRYAVLSRVPPPSLAGAQNDQSGSAGPAAGLSADTAALYLALPAGVPERVLELAQRVAGTAPGPYEQAERIEAYLRRFAYNLDLPRPPLNRDLVDWFLFDLQQGYCDYYASAMVVMARAAGLPARLAVGYAQGSYDPAGDAWQVTALDAHSWPEIYIEGAGWIEFEPTAGQPALVRPGDTAAGEEAVPLPPRPGTWLTRIPWGLVALAGLAALLLAAITWLWRPKPEYTRHAAGLVRDRYARLLRWGRRLGHPLLGGQTALEYGRELGQDLGRRGQGAPLPQAREAGSRAPAEIERLAAALSEAQYARQPLEDRTAWQVRALWSRLRRRLLWLWLAGTRRHSP
jgi:transglutaminase-like putative cysteine protease